MSGVTSIEVVPATATPSPTLTPPVVRPPTEAANTLVPQKQAETHLADVPEATEAPEATQTPEAPEVTETEVPKASQVPDAPKVKPTAAPDPADARDALSFCVLTLS